MICPGTSVTFTAIPLNFGGGTVSYIWEKNGIAGSILITTADGENFDQLLETAFPLLAEKQKRVVVYCGDLGCGMSREIAKRIRDYQLVPEVRALHGGWKALEQAGMLSRKN
jgi:rhodanese-related sulfurtransferase